MFNQSEQYQQKVKPELMTTSEVMAPIQRPDQLWINPHLNSWVPITILLMKIVWNYDWRNHFEDTL